MHTSQEPKRRHRSVFALWAIAIAAGAIAAPIVFDRLESSLDPAATSEAETVEARMIDTTGFSGNIAAIISMDPTAPTTETGVQGAIDEIGRLYGIARVGGGTAASGTSGDNFLITFDLEPNLSGDEAEALIGSVRDTLEQLAPGRVGMGGSVILDHELGATAESDLVRADLIAIPLVIALTALALGGLRATALPLSIVLAAVTTPLALLLGLSQVTEVSVFAVNVVSMFGVGLAVDYGLLVGSRYREELPPTATIALRLPQQCRLPDEQSHIPGSRWRPLSAVCSSSGNRCCGHWLTAVSVRYWWQSWPHEPSCRHSSGASRIC